MPFVFGPCRGHPHHIVLQSWNFRTARSHLHHEDLLFGRRLVSLLVHHIYLHSLENTQLNPSPKAHTRLELMPRLSSTLLELDGVKYQAHARGDAALTGRGAKFCAAALKKSGAILSLHLEVAAHKKCTAN